MKVGVLHTISALTSICWMSRKNFAKLYKCVISEVSCEENAGDCHRLARYKFIKQKVKLLMQFIVNEQWLLQRILPVRQATYEFDYCFLLHDNVASHNATIVWLFWPPFVSVRLSLCWCFIFLFVPQSQNDIFFHLLVHLYCGHFGIMVTRIIHFIIWWMCSVQRAHPLRPSPSHATHRSTWAFSNIFFSNTNGKMLDCF